MSNDKVKFFVLWLLLLFFQSIKSQDALSADELENLLQKAEKQSQNYSVVFQNLSAEETKIISSFKRDGTLDEKRVIKSIFVVYQSPNAENAQEFRNVLEYNGRNVSRSDRETAVFFDKLAETGTTDTEYNRLRSESLRYDGKRISWGITLFQPRPFNENLKANFKFTVVGKEKIQGRDVWLIEYEQTKPSSYILSNPTAQEKQPQTATRYNMPVSEAFRPTNPLMKGRIWLDAETGQIWRNQYKIILHPAKLSKSVEGGDILYEYQSSEFGILTPKKFVIKTYKISGTSDKDLTVRTDSEIVYEYARFSEFKTEIKDYKIVR
jgi:hypothetical protein